jgi:hypothetical protein
MSEKIISKSNFLFSFLGALGAILIFVLIIFIAYLPNRPLPVDEAVVAKRQETADAARATSESKLEGYAVINADAGIVRIPIEEAMKRTLANYQNASETMN